MTLPKTKIIIWTTIISWSPNDRSLGKSVLLSFGKELNPPSESIADMYPTYNHLPVLIFKHIKEDLLTLEWKCEKSSVNTGLSQGGNFPGLKPW